MSARRIMIMAGGTGGHVFPGLAVARALRRRSLEVVWLGTQRGLEARLVPAANIPIEWVKVGGLRGKGLATWLGAPLRLASALWQSMQVLRRQRPAVVLGMGGFVSGPGGLAARLLRLPLLIHEQNAIAGLTNRILARVAVRCYEAFPGSFAARRGAIRVGNPVREEISGLAPPEERLGGRTGPIRVLVFGGSQGALALNRLVPAALAGLVAEHPVEIRHQAGERFLDMAREEYRAAGLAAQVVAFIDDMAGAYAWADLVICRAGALTVSELAAAGVAAVLIPFPAAVDDHQTANARYLSEAGAARLVPEAGLTAAQLARELAPLVADRARLVRMAVAARGRAMTHAVERLVEACIAFGGKR